MNNMNFDPLGSMGSIYTNTNTAVVPPEGMVITAIQFLADNILTELISEHSYDSNDKRRHISTDVTHNIGDHQVTAGNGNVSGPTITLTTASSNIKVGQRISGHANFPNIVDYTTGLKPIYVKAVSGVTVTLSRDAALPNGTAMTFHDHLGQGLGGVQTDAAVFPKGMTIYGRWTSVKATADANGGIICYLGTANKYANKF